MRKHTIALSLCGLSVAALAVASPQAPTTPQAGGGQPGAQTGTHHHAASTGKSESASAEGFMKQAATDGMAEVELGQLASSKATRPEVRDFAQMMVTDHGKANDELKDLASRKNVTLPTGPTAAQKAEKARLEKLSGAAFDSAYVKAMEKDHRSAVSLFSRQASSGSDSDVKQWADQTLPKLKEHLAKAEQLAGTKGASTAAKKGSSSR